jgi:hypothetical protein
MALYFHNRKKSDLENLEMQRNITNVLAYIRNYYPKVKVIFIFN